MSHSTHVGRSSMQRQRKLRLESLETRHMLSHPAVAAVNVASTQWAPSFVSYLESSGLGTAGYKIPVGSSAQLQTLSWKNIDQICITFTENVVITAGDLSVSGTNKTAYAFSGFTYDPMTHTGVWTLDAPIAKDKLMLDLDADGLAPVRSAATGEVLDGAWTNCVSTYPSGNTQGGTDFEFRFNVLPGDANASGGVSLSDAILVLQQKNKIAGQTGYNIRYDFDGSGVITIDDYNIIPPLVGGSLPTGNPVGMTDDAPTTRGIPDLSIAKGTIDHVLSLTDFFADTETAPANLVYSIVGNTNSSLFDSLNIDSSSHLTLDFANGIRGDSEITIRATDAAGLIVDTTFAVHVSDAPSISNFYCINEIGDVWTLTGIVIDNDDPVDGDTVTFGGVFAGYNLTTTVRADGVFCLTVELHGLQQGTGTAQTSDPHGVLSNIAGDWIIV
jgi:hypothetical protein